MRLKKHSQETKMEIKQPITCGNFFHIYNRGINSCVIFKNKEDFYHFLKLYKIYFASVADTFAWCLMSNHFHLLVKIKEYNEIACLKPENKDFKGSRKWEVFFPDESYSDKKLLKLKKPVPEKQLSHLFNSYAKWYNKKYNRTGKLFETRFERILINNEKYLKDLIFYIHNNPVHHNVVGKIDEYKWTSYMTILSDKRTNLERETVIDWFEDIDNFKYYHNRNSELNEIENLLLE
ncbi:MAG: hypothetical protein L3J35_02150 [Bacteroidales bacterium]|nr:hypothetical protein [Bacteroidales bacterium]